MNSKKVAENIIDEKVYSLTAWLKTKLVLIGVTLFVAGFIFNFPLKKIIEGQIVKALSANKACPISYSIMNLSLFLPSVSFKDMKISGLCFQNPQKSVAISDASVSLSLPLIIPPSIKLYASLTEGKTNIQVYPRVRFGEITTKITSSNITGSFISGFTNFPNILKGNFAPEVLATVKDNKLEKMKISLESEDLIIPGQNIQGFDIPLLDIKKFLLQGTMEKQKLNIKNLTVGSEASPIFAQLKGNIFINSENFNFSDLNIVGEVSFSSDFLSKFGILNMLLSGKNKQNGKYQIQLTGKVSSPKFAVL